LIVGTQEGIKVIDLPTNKIIQTIQEVSNINANDVTFKSKAKLGCTSLAWNKSQTHLYSGWTDNNIRVYKIDVASQE